MYQPTAEELRKRQEFENKLSTMFGCPYSELTSTWVDDEDRKKGQIALYIGDNEGWWERIDSIENERQPTFETVLWDTCITRKDGPIVGYVNGHPIREEGTPIYVAMTYGMPDSMYYKTADQDILHQAWLDANEGDLDDNGEPLVYM